MKQRITIVLIGMSMLLLFNACNSGQNKKDSDLPIKVEWKIISNQHLDEPAALMEFRITNNSDIILTSDNWSLYFNQPPRRVLETPENSEAEVSKVKGDWYQLQLNSDKELAPGESFKSTYTLSHWIIKESDAPQGLYSTLYDANGEIDQHILISDYSIEGFETPEQIDRHRHDNIPIPTAEWQFEHNKSLLFDDTIEMLPLIPQPKEIKLSNKEVILSNAFTIVAADELKNESGYLAEMLQSISGEPFTINKEASVKNITLQIDQAISNEEGYTLKIEEDKIQISGGSATGVFYGIQSLLNAIDYSYYKNPKAEISLNAMEVTDAPRFSYRGLHLDVCRNFQSKEEILRVLDIMAFYKLNKLHFYITEDEGWRIEIKSIPELTEYGSKRGHSIDESKHLMPAYGSGPFIDHTDSYGSGYYSREDYIEILKHAQSRHIEVIPSINFPGHARAAVQSMEYRYRKYMASGDTVNAMKYRLIDPADKSKYASVQGYTDNVVDVGLESTYAFFETVVDDVIEIYKEANVPLLTIHTGGDEVPNGVWTASPASKKLLESQSDIHDPKNLQAYFFDRICNIIYSRGLTTGGWEEIALTRTPEGDHTVNPSFTEKNVIPYVWNNFGHAVDLGHKLANAGYPIVFCGVTNLYFDMAYNKDPKEPGYYWGGFVNERKVWELSPFNLIETTTTDNMGHPVNLENKVALSDMGKNNIIGLQAELWSETVKGGEMLEYYILPKLISFAERAWSKQPSWELLPVNEARNRQMNKEWAPFINTVANQELLRLNYLYKGYNYRIPPPGVLVQNKEIFVNHEYPGMDVYFTTDGSEPTEQSERYTEAIPYSSSVKLKAIDREGKACRMVEISEK